LEAFRRKKAKERLDRVERIQKRLDQIRGQSAAVACSMSDPDRNAVQKSATKALAGGLLKDTTNRVSDPSVATGSRELSARAKLVARKLNQSRSDGKMSGVRRLTVTLSASLATSEAKTGQKCDSGMQNIREHTTDENIPRLDDDDRYFPNGMISKPLRGKR